MSAMSFLHRPSSHKYSLYEIRSTLQDHPDAIQDLDCNGNTVLHRAARHSCSDTISFITKADPTLHTRLNADQQTPLHVAARYANVAAVSVLLPSSQALLTARDREGRTPLHLAATSMHGKRERAFQILYDALPAAAAMTLDGDGTLLHAAVDCINLHAVECLASQFPALLSARNQDGQLAVDVAARKYAHRQSWTTENLRRLQSLHGVLAVLLRTTPISEFGSLAALDAKHGGSSTLLHRACLFGHTDVARAILAIDTRASAVRDTQCRLPIHVAADYSRVDTVKELLNVWPESASAKDDQLNTPLHYAAGDDLACDSFTVDLLLQAAPLEAHSLNLRMETPLLRAASFGNAHAMHRLLVAAPQTAEVTDEDGLPPICVAVMELQDDNMDACVELLLRYAPHTAKLQTPYGFTALHHAAELHRLGAVNAILAKCPETAAVTTPLDGLTAVHLAMMPKEDENCIYTDDTAAWPVVRSLLAVTPDLARRQLCFWDVQKCTPLHVAAALIMPLCMRELLAVDPHAIFLENAERLSALDWALMYGRSSPCTRLILHQQWADAGTINAVLRMLHAHSATDSEFLIAIASNLPLPDECWALVPWNVEGLLGVLGAALRRGSVNDVRELVERLPIPEHKRLVTALASLRKVARALGDDAVRSILTFSFDDAP